MSVGSNSLNLDALIWSKILDFFSEQEDEKRREERDERKRKYNVKYNDEVHLNLQFLAFNSLLYLYFFVLLPHLSF